MKKSVVKYFKVVSELFSDLEADFISIQDNIDTSTAMGKFFFRTMASIAELERDIISERTKTGLQTARARGRNLRGSVRKIEFTTVSSLHQKNDSL